jgi:hypothetical protein
MIPPTIYRRNRFLINPETPTSSRIGVSFFRREYCVLRKTHYSLLTTHDTLLTRHRKKSKITLRFDGSRWIISQGNTYTYGKTIAF